jgi:hypothetical protein
LAHGELPASQKDVKVKQTYAIWYMKPTYFQDGCMGYDFCAKYRRLPNHQDLQATHILLTELELPENTNLDYIFVQMQGEVWSPNGEANDLIKEKGLAHTSMCVGDIIVGNGEIYMVDRNGFTVLASSALA